MWKSGVELDSELKTLPNLPGLVTLYSLSVFFLNAFYPEGYRASDDWKSVLILSDYGKRSLSNLQPSLSDFPQADVLLALFAKFFHHELFFDFQKVESLNVRQILERELLQERLRLPYRFGRLLYDRFNDTYLDTRTDHLMGREAERLLQGSPVGVFQLDKLISGPLGIIDSQESRWAPPTLNLPLWHCSDTGCNSLHQVKLVEPSVPAVEALSRIEKLMSDRFGPPSDWRSTLTRLHRGLEPSPRAYIDLPASIADCILGRERTVLLTSALLGPNRDQLRRVVGSPPRQKREAEGSAREIASRLTCEAQLQLLMVLRDVDLVGLIDDVLIAKQIRVPLGEIRELTYGTPRLPKDSGSQISALGIRSTRQNPVVNLTCAIRRVYQRLGHANELAWRVRGGAGGSLDEALVAFVRNRGPAVAVRELILSSAAITAAVCDDVQVPVKYASGADDLAIDRLLWKLGFDPMQFDDSIERFHRRLAEFKETILANSPIAGEDARSRVREKGVNVFVSLEDFLDRLIAYNIWLLSSDHFIGTKLMFSPDDARRAVAQTLGESLPSGDTTLTWKVDGENPLGTLLRYLRAATDWVQGLPAMDPTSLRRAEDDLPHFADDPSLPFPFRHVALWADSSRNELRSYAEAFGRIVKLIEESEPAAIRNGLDHYRESERFPAIDKLLACVTRIEEALGLADAGRFLPKVFWLFSRGSDRFGTRQYEFRDYAGGRVPLYGPDLVSALGNVDYESAYLLAPGNLLGTPNSSLIFQLREPSEFSSYWKDYPRRRRIAATEGTEPPADDSSTAPTPDVSQVRRNGDVRDEPVSTRAPVGSTAVKNE
jgi:hypothetical protein